MLMYKYSASCKNYGFGTCIKIVYCAANTVGFSLPVPNYTCFKLTFTCLLCETICSLMCVPAWKFRVQFIEIMLPNAVPNEIYDHNLKHFDRILEVQYNTMIKYARDLNPREGFKSVSEFGPT